MPRLHTLQNLKRFMIITHSGIFNPRQLHHRSRVNIVDIHIIYSDIQRAARIERKDLVTNLLGAVLPPRGFKKIAQGSDQLLRKTVCLVYRRHSLPFRFGSPERTT